LIDLIIFSVLSSVLRSFLASYGCIGEYFDYHQQNFEVRVKPPKQSNDALP
jgi:hypothetical protein